MAGLRRPVRFVQVGLAGALIIFLLDLPTARFAEAQPERKIARIGVLMVGAPSAARTYIQGFEQGLRGLGYRK